MLAIVDANGKADTYSPDANDGRQIAVGILEQAQDMLVEGVATDRFTQMLVHGLVTRGRADRPRCAGQAAARRAVRVRPRDARRRPAC